MPSSHRAARGQMSDSLLTASFIILSGGLQDAYTYLCRGKVFANAQTGNIVLLSAYLFEGDTARAVRYLAAAAGPGGDIRLEGVDYRHLSAVATMLRQAGCRLTCGETSIRLQAPRRLQSAGPIRTAPYPGFPTDAQAVLMASLLRSEGATVFVENIFDSRYRHVPEMVRMGADIRLEGRVAVVCGVDRLHGAAVRAKELRGGASLVLAGLQAEGETAVTGVEHIQRGYEDLTGELAQLGADIRQEER